ncbi:MAG: hypothetical protein ACRDZ2_00100, partial [Ilumatobacteraceae bacterium]
MTGLARRDRLRRWWVRGLGIVLAGAVGVVGIRLESFWLTVLAAALAGWLVASVAYVTASVFAGRILGWSTTGAVFILGWLPHWWKWFVVLPGVAVLVILVLRVSGSRKVDVVPTDRTKVPILSDEGNRLVDAMDAMWGSTRPGGPRCGLRAAHGHGTLAEGTWHSTYSDDSQAADRRLQVPLFAGPGGGRAVARFSNFPGEVTRDDRRRSPHGLAIRLEGGDRGTMDVVLVDITRFPAGNREDFVSFTQAFAQHGLRRYVRLAALVLTGRSSIRALLGMLRRRGLSYGARTYHGLNTFFWQLEPDRDPAPVRYVARPVREPGRRRSVTGRSASALDEELRRRLADGPVELDIVLVVGRSTGFRQ